MISRYTRPEMGRLWDEAAMYATWLEVELAAAEGRFGGPLNDIIATQSRELVALVF